MQYGDSQRFATSRVLRFVPYRIRCTACVLTQQVRELFDTSVNCLIPSVNYLIPPLVIQPPSVNYLMPP